MLGTTRQRVNEKHIGSELSQGLGHFRSAATLAAGRTAKRVGPAITSTRDRMSPRMEQAREAAGRAWEQRIKRSAEETTKRAKSAEKMSRRAQRNAKRASMDATRLSRRAGRQQAMKPGTAMGGRAMKRQAMQTQPPRRRRWMLGAIGIGALVGAIGAMISRRRSPEWEAYEPTEPASGAIGETVTDMADAARRKTGSVVEEPGGLGRHAAETEPGPGAPVTGPTTEPSSMRSPDVRPPGS